MDESRETLATRSIVSAAASALPCRPARLRVTVSTLRADSRPPLNAIPIPATAAAPAAAAPTLRALVIPEETRLPTFSPTLSTPVICLSRSFLKFLAEGVTLMYPTPSSTAPEPNPPLAILLAPFGQRRTRYAIRNPMRSCLVELHSAWLGCRLSTSFVPPSDRGSMWSTVALIGLGYLMLVSICFEHIPHVWLSRASRSGRCRAHAYAVPRPHLSHSRVSMRFLRPL